MRKETADELPRAFRERCDALARSYLAHPDDPRRQSGFGGGAARWRAEREPILEAVDGHGSVLDVGCANGYLLECLVAWGRERGLALEPFGVDRSAELVALARRRLPAWRDRFFVADAWSFRPPRRFDLVYTLFDCVPPTHLAAYLGRLARRCVATGGRLAVGAYGSRSRGIAPIDPAGALSDAGLRVVGAGAGGEGPLVRVAWADPEPEPAGR